MTMVPMLRELVRRTLACSGLVWLAMTAPVPAQSTAVHYQFQGLEPPGVIGSMRLARGGPLPGYFQPVEIKAPAGASISLAKEGAFATPAAAPRKVGLLIGQVYRIRVTNIPLHPGEEVYPSIELIDRIYPPCGEELRFPIPIELTQEDLELALAGKFVTRVVYLEEPDSALPVALKPNDQPWFDAGPGSNPLQVADELGRPVVIVRLGGRVPDTQAGPDAKFLYGSPPFMTWNFEAAAPGQNEKKPSERVPAPQPDTTAKAGSVKPGPPPNRAPRAELGEGPSSIKVRSTADKNALRDESASTHPIRSSRRTTREPMQR